ncbi:superfamily II DNA/RNA helicase [Conyzicola lurida]|uniref:Superfamily II DNA/RNA helicase n=1 Tax=Conyzicola lurida TaxID=1172621 RepID=A0A841AUK7_9MICO|nr:DEAD/DEAH box helicase [Conyzicola lurida]MBB5845099.1 superfamily II DNA/RNA helicase [Conyzicola lurida]
MSPYSKPDYNRADRDNKKPYSPRGGDARNSRPDQGGAPKKRWTGDDRAARTGDRPASGDRRPDWNPREKPAYGDRPNRNNGAPRSERPAYGDRPARSAYGDRNERPSYNDRPARSNSDRPSYNNDRPSYGDRPARPSYGDRTDRPARTERPAYGNDRPSYNGERPATNDRQPRTPYNERQGRTERPSYNNDRPSYGDRPARTDRSSYNSERPARTERPSYNSDRPARPSYGERTERPSYGSDRPARTERPSYNSDRPARTERPSYGDRGARPSYDRAERPARDSSYYPSKDGAANKSHSGGGMQEDVVLERLEAAVITAKDVEGVTFGDLGLGANIVRQLESMGAAAPFAIQAATIPDVLAGKDVLGRGKTGSGKTIAFGAPLVERLMENNGGKDRQAGRKPRALILAPTRELAMQIDRTVQPIARSVGLFTTTIVGGVPQYKQVSALQRGVDIIIATPGRVEDLVEQGRLDLSNVIVSVLDEADHMCDLGFLEPVQRILKETKEGGQKLLFSATLDKGVATLVKQFLKNPSVHEVAGEDQASSTIDHKVLLIEQRDKRELIRELAAGEGKTLVFTRTRAFAEEMSDYLEDAGIPATSLHGDLNQSRRTRNLQLLTSGRVNVLVATDVAARGIHVDDISLVIQADAPEEYKTYLHRAGRTGRAGKVGTVVTLIPRARRRKMDELLERAEIKATVIQAAPGDQTIADLAAL